MFHIFDVLKRVQKTVQANLPPPPSQCFLASKVYLIPVARALKDGSIYLHREHLSHVERFLKFLSLQRCTWKCLKKGHHVNHQGATFLESRCFCAKKQFVIISYMRLQYQLPNLACACIWSSFVGLVIFYSWWRC